MDNYFINVKYEKLIELQKTRIEKYCNEVAELDGQLEDEQNENQEKVDKATRKLDSQKQKMIQQETRLLDAVKLAHQTEEQRKKLHLEMHKYEKLIEQMNEEISLFENENKQV